LREQDARGREEGKIVADRLEEWQVRRLGQENLAIRVRDVARESRAALGAVDAHDHGAGERGAAEREEVLRTLSIKTPTVKRALRIAYREE